MDILECTNIPWCDHSKGLNKHPERGTAHNNNKNFYWPFKTQKTQSAKKSCFLSGQKCWNMVNFGFITSSQNFNSRMSLVIKRWHLAYQSEWLKGVGAGDVIPPKKWNIRLRAARSEMLKSKGQVMIKWRACYLQVVGYWQWSDVKLPQTASDL